MAVHEHKQQADSSVQCAVITVSDTRTKDTDKSGQIITDLLTAHQHHIQKRDIVKDEEAMITEALQNCCHDEAIDAVLVNGGTGIATRDVTYDVVQQLLQKELSGFGEIFRMLSYTEDIGSAAILSRAIAGVSAGTMIFSMPGSSGAVTLAMNRLIIPELSHAVWEMKR